MEAMTIEKLKMLDAKHGTKSAPKKRRLKVFYGWARLGKVRKRVRLEVNSKHGAVPTNHRL